MKPRPPAIEAAFTPLRRKVDIGQRDYGLCLCPECIAARPERAQAKERHRKRLRRRVMGAAT